MSIDEIRYRNDGFNFPLRSLVRQCITQHVNLFAAEESVSPYDPSDENIPDAGPLFVCRNYVVHTICMLM